MPPTELRGGSTMRAEHSPPPSPFPAPPPHPSTGQLSPSTAPSPQPSQLGGAQGQSQLGDGGKEAATRCADPAVHEGTAGEQHASPSQEPPPPWGWSWGERGGSRRWGSGGGGGQRQHSVRGIWGTQHCYFLLLVPRGPSPSAAPRLRPSPLSSASLPSFLRSCPFFSP